MMLSRTAFCSLSGALGVSAITQTTPKGNMTKPKSAQFFTDGPMNFVILGVLGAAYYGAADVGAVLAIIDEIEDGNPASAFAALTSHGERLRALADAALAAGHHVTARESYLQSSTYTFAATYFCDGGGIPEKMGPTWKRSRTALDAAFALFEPAVERVSIPYAGTTLPGYWFKVDASDLPRPVLILNNGSDGSVLDLWVNGAAAGVARGYNCLVFDGPGQGAALWEQRLSFRPDWEHVITPVVDYVLTRKDADPKRLALQGISQGGYWVPRAMGFEHRVAAAIADPGVFDISTSWIHNLPPPLIAMLDRGDKASFDHAMQGTQKELATYTFRARPYGFASPFDMFSGVREYTLHGIVDKIACPVLVTDPDFESFWPGQSQQLYDALRSPKALARFTVAEGAEFHCEPMATGLRGQRIFDWLDAILANPSSAPART